MSDKLSEHMFSQNDEIVEYLKTARLFSTVSSEFRKQIADISNIVDYDTGTEILKQGDENNRLFFLMRGNLGVYVDGKHIVDLRRKGDIIGEMSMIAEKKCSATVRAESKVRLFEISHEHLSSYKELDQGELDKIMYKIFAMILTEKLELTSSKAKEFESTYRTLVESKKSFYEMIEHAPEAVFELDLEGRIRYFNRKAEESSGYKREDILGKLIMDTGLIDQGNQQTINQFGQQLLEGESAYELEVPFTNKQGESLMTQLSTWNLKDGYLITVRNITERKQTERELKQAHEELERRVVERTEQLTALNRELQQEIAERKRAQEAEKVQAQQLIQADKLMTLGILVSGVAHEINNPNQFITSHISPLQKAWEGATPILDEYYRERGDFRIGGMNYSNFRDRVPGIFSNITEGSKRINNIVQELKEYVRDYPSERTETFNFNSVVQSALTLTSNMVNKSTNHFSMELGQNMPLYTGHYQQVEQVVINLVQNACQALTGPDESLSITTFYDGEARTINLTVMDEGVGIEDNHYERVTDPFYTTKRDAGGIGLGLSISSKIIMGHGGTLDFTSGPEKGTIATISLPVDKETS